MVKFVGLNTAGGDNTAFIDDVRVFNSLPFPPAGLQAVAGNGIVTLTWTPIAGATGYTVLRSNLPNGQPSQTTVASGLTATTYVDNTVVPGQTYYYRISASGPLGTILSTEASATPGYNANLGFELPVVGSTNFAQDPAGAGWTFTGSAGITGGNSILNDDNFLPHVVEGNQTAYIDQTGSFSQSLPFTAGSHTISFSAAQSAAFTVMRFEDFQVLVDGTVVGTFEPSSASFTTLATAPFTVTAGNHTVSFVGLNSIGGDQIALIDNVQIGPPDPVLH